MTDNNLAKITAPNVVFEPRSLVERAIAAGSGIDVIERLMTAQERWEATQAKKAFNAAIAAFKANPPKILKDVEVNFVGRTGGQTSYRHEDLAQLLAAVDPALAEHGLWARFKVNSDNNLVTVTCVIGHADGYSEDDNRLTAAPDTSGGKNAVQAIGSAVSYLQRYTLKSALGMAAARDDDGRSAGKPVNDARVSEEQVEEINTLLVGQTEKLKKKLLELAHVANVSDIASIHFDSCKDFIKKHGKAAK